MTILELIILYLIIIFTISTGGYIFYLNQTANIYKQSNLITNPSPSKSPASSISDSNNCDDFQARLGITSEELVEFINNEPESAKVLKGYQNLFGNVTGILPGDSLPLKIELSNGKIISLTCTESLTKRDYSQDIDFTIPQTDLAQIIRYRETLETDQVVSYMQNLTSNPPEAKTIILERIQALE